MTSGRRNADDLTVTEHEGQLLAGIAREQPITTYQVFRMAEESPVSSLNSSKGQVYPAIRRLKARDFLKAARVAGDGRNSEELMLTERGEAAIRQWILATSDAHVVLDDPLRTRVVAFDFLTKSERLEWISKAKALVKARQEYLDTFNRSVKLPYQDIAYRNACDMLRVKMEWLDELLYHVASSN